MRTPNNGVEDLITNPTSHSLKLVDSSTDLRVNSDDKLDLPPSIVVETEFFFTIVVSAL